MNTFSIIGVAIDAGESPEQEIFVRRPQVGVSVARIAGQAKAGRV